MRYGSVCSGIEAATAAWHPLGWEPAFFSEIEAFPSAVLKYHYPDVPLHGDFTTIGQHQYGQIDLLVGGTPCQSFSVAGLRGGLDDDRGNLALEFCRLAQREQPRWIVWENVPGVLSSGGGRDFGSILGALEDLGYGLAYRVLDAQFFGVPQRRRRVFVVGYLGDWRPAAAVLFERHGLSGHSAPRREAREDTTHGLAPCLTSSGRGVERTGDTRGQDPVVAVGRERPAVSGAMPHVSPTLRAGGNKTGGDRPPGTDVDTADSLIPVLSRPSVCADVAGPLTAKGPTAMGAPEVDGNHYIASTAPIAFGGQMSEPMVDINLSLTLQAKNPQAVAYGLTTEQTPKFAPELALTLTKQSPTGGGQPQAVVFDTTQITSPQNYSNPQPGDPCHPLAAGAHPPAIAIEQPVPIQNATRGKDQNGLGIGGEVMYTLDKTSQHGVAYDPIAFSAKDYGGDAGPISPTLRSGSHAGSHANGGVMPAVVQNWAVRRLTPVECERLQGFPDGFTDIPWRKKPAGDCPDGPRYKALGNSMAVPVMRWIGERIQLVDDLLSLI